MREGRSNISSMRRRVSTPDETLRRELKNDAQRSIVDELPGVSSGDETPSQMRDINSQTKIQNDFRSRN